MSLPVPASTEPVSGLQKPHDTAASSGSVPPSSPTGIGSRPSSISSSGDTGVPERKIEPIILAEPKKGVISTVFSFLTAPFRWIGAAFINVYHWLRPDYNMIKMKLQELDGMLQANSVDAKLYNCFDGWVKKGLQNQWQTQSSEGTFADALQNSAQAERCRSCIREFYQGAIAPKLAKRK